MELPELNDQLELLKMLEENRDFYVSPDTQNNSYVVNQDAELSSTWLNVPTLDGFNHNIPADQGDIYSDTESLTSCGSAVASPAVFQNTEQEGHFTYPLSMQDNELKQLSVKELNLKLKGQPKELVKMVKKRRRTLKNRGYAHSCRIKRLQEKSTLQKTKAELESMIQDLQQKLGAVESEKDIYKSRYETLVRRIVMSRSQQNIFKS